MADNPHPDSNDKPADQHEFDNRDEHQDGDARARKDADSNAADQWGDDFLPAEEDDPRFPSGPWTGFYLQPQTQRHDMELDLHFEAGVIRGDGHDDVGDFIVRGRYELSDGKCHFHKRYVGQHDVYYEGYNEGKGMYGKWEINSLFMTHGGFRIWPKGMPDPTIHRISNAIDLPPVTFDNLEGELIQVGVGGELLDEAPTPTRESHQSSG